MSIVLEDSIYILPEKVTISSLETLRNEIIHFIEKNTVITLDGSIVEEIDGAGFQLILSAQKYSLSQLKPFSLIDASNILRNVLEMSGLLELIEDE